MSVTVVTKTLDEIAGSIFNLSRDTGINIPKNPATVILMIIATAIRIESPTS